MCIFLETKLLDEDCFFVVAKTGESEGVCFNGVAVYVAPHVQPWRDFIVFFLFVDFFLVNSFNPVYTHTHTLELTFLR